MQTEIMFDEFCAWRMSVIIFKSDYSKWCFLRLCAPYVDDVTHSSLNKMAASLTTVIHFTSDSWHFFFFQDQFRSTFNNINWSGIQQGHSFRQEMGLKFREVTKVVLHVQKSFYDAATWTLRKVDQKYVESFEMWCWRRIERIRWIDRMKKEVLHGVKEERNVLNTVKRRKAEWVGHVLCRNCLLKHVVEGKIEGKGKRGRRLKQLREYLSD